MRVMLSVIFSNLLYVTLMLVTSHFVDIKDVHTIHAEKTVEIKLELHSEK